MFVKVHALSELTVHLFNDSQNERQKFRLNLKQKCKVFVNVNRFVLH